MRRQSVSVLLPSGHTLYLEQEEHESSAEFHGRKLCEIEEWISGRRGPTPRGTRWAEWRHDGHPLGDFHADGLGIVVESTGNPYADRTIRVPGLYNLTEARAALGI